MKYIFYLSLLLISRTCFAGCEDIARPMMFRWRIVQKIQEHIYEIASVDRGAGDPNIRAILLTRRANFKRMGYPFGLKVAPAGDINLPLQNGFEQRFSVLKECGIVPLPEGNVMWEPGMSVRNRLKEDQ